MKTIDLRSDNRIKFLLYGLIGFLLFLPVHTPLTTFLGSVFGNNEVFIPIKEGFLLVMVLIAGWLLITEKPLRDRILGRLINKLIAGYALLHLLLAVISDNHLLATFGGLAYNLRFLAVFIIAQIVFEAYGSMQSRQELRRKILKFALIGMAIVAVFGALQVLVLPDDILTHIGYGKDTVRPFLTIDNIADYVRINSTLRGPNPLGAYMMVALLVGLGAWFKYPAWRRNLAYLAPLGLITLYGSQSRSAWIGFFLGLAVFFGLILWRDKRWRKWLAGAGAVFLLLFGGIFLLFRDSELIQVQLLHNSERNQLEKTSDLSRLQAYENGVEKIVEQPLGYGPGESGPASAHGEQRAFYSENYFLQIGIEAGVVGLVLLLAIVVLLVWHMYPHRGLAMPAAVLAGLAGFTVVNMTLHGWSDDAGPITWWLLAGLYMRK